MVFFIGNLSQTLALEKFFAHEICQFQQSSSTVEFVGVTDDGQCIVAVYYTSAITL